MYSYAELVPFLCLVMVFMVGVPFSIGFLIYTIYKSRKETDYDRYIKNSEPW